MTIADGDRLRVELLTRHVAAGYPTGERGSAYLSVRVSFGSVGLKYPS